MGNKHGKSRSAQKEAEQIRYMQICLKYTNDRKVNRIRQMQNLNFTSGNSQQSGIINQEQDMDGCTMFGCLQTNKKKRKEKIFKSYPEWLKQFIINSKEMDYSWAKNIKKTLKQMYNDRKISPLSQKNDQNQLIWSLAALFDIDIETKYNQSEEDLQVLEVSSEEEDQGQDNDNSQNQSFDQNNQNEQQEEEDEEFEYFNLNKDQNISQFQQKKEKSQIKVIVKNDSNFRENQRIKGGQQINANQSILEKTLGEVTNNFANQSILDNKKRNQKVGAMNQVLRNTDFFAEDFETIFKKQIENQDNLSDQSSEYDDKMYQQQFTQEYNNQQQQQGRIVNFNSNNGNQFRQSINNRTQTVGDISKNFVIIKKDNNNNNNSSKNSNNSKNSNGNTNNINNNSKEKENQDQNLQVFNRSRNKTMNDNIMLNNDQNQENKLQNKDEIKMIDNKTNQTNNQNKKQNTSGKKSNNMRNSFSTRKVTNATDKGDINLDVSDNGKSSKHQKKLAFYDNNTVIMKQQQNQTKRQKFRMMKIIAFYKKTTEILEMQFKTKKHIFYYIIKEFKKEFVNYYQGVFQQIMENNVNDSSDFSRLRESCVSISLNQSQIQNYNKKKNNQTTQQQKLIEDSIINYPRKETNDLNQSMLSEVSQYMDLNFQDYFDIAVEEIQDFVKLFNQILNSYYYIDGLSKHRYGKLLVEDNLHGFLVSYIFDNQISSLMMQYCLKINADKEQKYSQKLMEFQKVTPSQLGIREELQQMSYDYNSMKQRERESQKSSKLKSNFLKSGLSAFQTNNNNSSKQTDQNELLLSQQQKIQKDSYVYQDVIKIFQNLTYIPSPIHKLKLIVRCNELIVKEIQKIQEMEEQKSKIELQEKLKEKDADIQGLLEEQKRRKKKQDINLDGDDIVSAYIYIIGKSGVQSLFSQLKLIESFMNDSQRNNHTGFFYTTTFAAAQFLLDFSDDSLKQFTKK